MAVRHVCSHDEIGDSSSNDGRLAAVDDEGGSVDVARAVGDEKAHDVADVVGHSDPSRRDRLDQIGQQIGRASCRERV